MKRKNNIIRRLLGIAVVVAVLTFSDAIISVSSHIADSFLAPLLQSTIENMGKR